MTTSNKFTPLHLKIISNASATTLFDAWTIPAIAELWLFQSGKYPVDFIADVSEGGEFHTVEKGKNHAISHSGNYIKIDRPKTLLFSLAVPDHFEGTSEVSVEIKEEKDGCHLLFSQKNVDTSKNVESWTSMLADVDRILKAPYMITNTSGKKDLIEAINVVAAQLVGFIIPLTEEEINKIPYKDSWTAAQLINHIIKSITGMAAVLGKEAQPANREVTERIIELKQTFLDITRTMQSPGEIAPENKNYNKADVVKKLQDTLKQLKEAASEANISDLINGLPLGPITKLEILHFVLYHTQRHLFQMKRIVDALNE